VISATVNSVESDAGSVEPHGLSRLYLGPVVAIAATFVAVELAVAARYGLHRDELYFLACARHLAWGYVDQPPFVPAVARVAVSVFGTSAFGLRILPAVFGGVTIVFCAATARELGGGKRAQLFAALAAATSPQVLGTFHLLSTAAFDLFFWSAITFLVVRLLRTDDERWWIAIGTVAGIGLLNKFNVAFLAFGLVVGLVAAHRGRMIRSGWLWAGAAIAVAIWTPNLVWNAQHDWAAVAMLRSLHQENSTIGASISFVPSQLIVVGPILLPFWFAGLRRLLRHQFARPVGLAYVTLLIVDVVSGAKPYYLGGIYFVLFAGGGLWLEERLATTHRSPRRYAWWIALGAAAAIPLTLPVLPVTALPKGDWESNINKDLSATVGWDQVARQLGDVVATLPADERANVVVFTGDYGAAGAVDLYGKRYGLPRAISGHNSYWWWGHSDAADGATTVAVNLSRSYLLTIFSTVTPAGTVDTGHGVWTEERDAPIWICRNQKISWARAWPDARHYG
jgi:Dolichyl-phosphate-mannose-protein mannosyltransferase